MYKPPENSNRVKDIKNKFENNIVNTKSTAKPPLRKCNTLQEFNVKISGKDSITNFQKSYLNSNTKQINNQNSQLNLTRQLSDPSKRNIKRTPAFRVDRNVLTDNNFDQKNVRLQHNKTRYIDKKTNKLKEEPVTNPVNNESISIKTNKITITKREGNFSSIHNKFNGNCQVSFKNNSKKDTNSNNGNTQNTDKKQDIISNATLKFLYSQPLPKSQRNKISTETEVIDVHHSSTLKLPELQKDVDPKSDTDQNVNNKKNNSTSHVSKKSNSNENMCRKKDEDQSTVTPKKDVCLTDTLRNALKRPLPKGPAPKKPPRTFTHSPNKIDSPPDISPLNLNKYFTKKLNSELQKSLTKTPAGQKSKGDPKYMLDKLETVLRTKGVLVRKPKIESSEDESDNERNKSNLISTRELPLIPTSSSSCLVDTYYSTPENSPKFNFNCLTSLGCGTSTYEAVKEPNSLFFISCKKEEPVYAEPFEYQVAKDENVKDCHTDDCAIDGGEATFNAKTIRHSLHYASSPVPDLKAEDVDHVSDLKNQEQVCGSFDSNSSTSDMDSSISSPSEENKTLVSNTKVKELISAIENCNKSVVSRTNSNSSTTEKNNHNNTLITNNDHIKKLETHLKNVCEKSFTLPSPNNHESSDIDVDEDSENKKETKKFKTYVQRIRSKIFNSSPSKKDHLFYCCLLVALDRSSPYVKSKFPQTVQEPHKIAELCFPEVESGPMDTGTEAQCYSLIITNELGERTFGYCRRVLPEGSTACLPLAYCILSKHRAPGFYRRILEELEHRHGYPDMFIDAFIQELYNCKFPMPGDTMVIDCSKIITASCDKMKYKTLKSLSNKNNELPNSTNIIKGNIDRLKLTCDKDNLLQRNNTSEDSDMAIEKNSNHAELDLKSFVIVCNSGEYGTLLRSHKDNNTRGNSAIINVPYEIPATKLKRSTSSPNLLSDMESLPSEVVLMRPFDSRHEENDLMLLGDTLKTPILQQVFCSLLLERKVILVSNMLSKLSSCIEALQMILYPFSWQHTIIPVLPQSLWEIVDTPTPLVCGVLSAEVVNDYEIKNGIVVDLDSSTVLQQVGDEDRILPSSLVQTLKDGLSLASKIASSNSGAHNIFFSDAFLRVFIQTCGHYKEFIVDGDFKKSNFMEYCKHKGKRNRLFLKWFTETSMFYNFIETALTNSNNLDLFDQRIKIYSSQSAVEILSKMKNWSGYKGFLSSTLIRFQ